MDHTTDEQLQTFLDHEDTDVERAAVTRHVEACALCQSRLAALEALSADVSGAVGLLRPPPATRPAFGMLEARALAAQTVAPAPGVSNGRNALQTSQASPSPTPRAGGRRSSRASPARPRVSAIGRSSATMAASWLRAAAVVLAVAGVASATTIVVQRSALDRAQQSSAGRSEQAAPAGIEAQVARSGVSVLPNAGRIVIAVRGAAAGTTIDVGIADAGAASAFVRGDGEGVRFSAQSGRIDVDATGRAIALDVRLPASATNATVLVDGLVRARNVDGRLRVERGGNAVTVRASTGR